MAIEKSHVELLSESYRRHVIMKLSEDELMEDL